MRAARLIQKPLLRTLILYIIQQGLSMEKSRGWRPSAATGSGLSIETHSHPTILLEDLEGARHE
jgi:hypothetical protein